MFLSTGGIVTKNRKNNNSEMKTCKTLSMLVNKSITAKKKNSRRNKRITIPRLRDYFAYARTVQNRDSADVTKIVRLPSFEEEGKLFRSICNFDDNHNKSYCDIENYNCANHKFDENFIRTIHTLFDVNSRLSLNVTQGQIMNQLNAKRWRETYYNDSRLGLFDRGVPILIRISLNKENNEEDPFAAFVRNYHVKPIRFDISHILFSKCTLDHMDRIDSLESIDLRALGIRSLYYRRLYLVHLFIWIIVSKGTYLYIEKYFLFL